MVLVCLHGCDDGTVAEVEVTPEENEFLIRLVEVVNDASTYGCQPTMEIINASTS